MAMGTQEEVLRRQLDEGSRGEGERTEELCSHDTARGHCDA